MVPTTTRSVWRIPDGCLGLLSFALFMVGMVALLTAYLSHLPDDGLLVTADATPGIMRVVVAADESKVEPTATMVTCEVLTPRNTTCMWRVTPTPLSACPPQGYPNPCIYPGPEAFRKGEDDKTPLAVGTPVPTGLGQHN